MRKMFIKFISVLSLGGSLFVIGLAVRAGTTATVAATATAQSVSVAVTDGTIAYGTLTLGASTDTVTGVDTQVATNDGNVTEDLNIKGSNSAAWTLGATSAADQYVHEFSTDNGGTWTALTTPGYQTLATSKAAAATQNFDLKITLPSSSASYAEQTVNVTVQAVAS